MIVSLIPTVLGTSYACLAGLGRDELIDAGVILPSSASAIIHEPPMDLATYLADADLRTIHRITGMTRDVVDLIEQHRPQRILIRIPCPKLGLRVPGVGSQAMYGLASGAVWAAVLHRWPGRCIPITDRRWRIERGDKQAMLNNVRRIYNAFDSADDPKGDIANAISLARWLLQGSF